MGKRSSRLARLEARVTSRSEALCSTGEPPFRGSGARAYLAKVLLSGHVTRVGVLRLLLLPSLLTAHRHRTTLGPPNWRRGEGARRPALRELANSLAQAAGREGSHLQPSKECDGWDEGRLQLQQALDVLARAQALAKVAEHQPREEARAVGRVDVLELELVLQPHHLLPVRHLALPAKNDSTAALHGTK
eukprot:6211970-Pleurochrysis_carterae.AAC.7